jgi:hypothetical protein
VRVGDNAVNYAVNCTSAEIEEILKVVQHKSLRQVEQEALKALGDDKERALVTLT